MFVKICGITNEEDALLAVALGAHAVGFVFAPSPRQVAPGLAGDIAKRLPPEVITVGVFRDDAPQRVVNLAHSARLHAVQLHGHEKADDARWIRARVPMLIQGFAAGDSRIAKAGDYGADAILIDAAHPGSGQVFDWSLVADVPPGQRFVLAGGLNPDNVGAAIATTGCWGVDVSSGVEREPGYKDPIRLRDFIQAATAAFEGIEAEHRSRDRDSEVYDWEVD